MDVAQIKLYLLDSPHRIEKLLEYFGFHGFNYAQDSLRCAVPDGDNTSSVAIYLNEVLPGVVYTRSSFKGDIFSIIEKFSGRKFADIIRVTRTLFNLPGSKSGIKQVDIVGNLRKYRKRNKSQETRNELHDGELVMRSFIRPPYVHEDIFHEGIAPDVLKSYNISYDPDKNRILFPHYDWIEHDKIVGIQGRIAGMTTKEASLLGVPKYWNYISGYYKRANLYGWSHAHENVKNEKKLIIFEGEKSVLKHATMTFNKSYAVAIGGHEIHDEQIKFIARNTTLDTEIIIAFDKDVTKDEEEYKKMMELGKRISLFRNTSVIIDRIDNGKILGEKDSPIDNGPLVWDYLFSEREPVHWDRERGI